MLIVPKAIAITRITLLKVSLPASPITSRPPSSTMPWIALVPDISGVCSVFGTFEITTKPMKPASTRIARLVVRTLASITPASTAAVGALVDDLAVLHHAAALDDLVLPVELQRAVLADEQLEQRLHVAREQLRGVLGHASRGRFSGETIFTSCRTTVSPGSVSSQLPPASPARSTITEPGFMPSTASAVTSFGAGRPGHERGRDDHVEALDRVGQRLLLGGALLLGQLARVAALAAGLEAEVEPLRAERFDLLGDLGPHVVAGRARAQPLGGRERLQARDADAQHQHLGGRDRARRRSSASGRSGRSPRRPSSTAL